MKILIIEDEKELSNNMAAYLTGENYFCEIAGNLRSALEKTEAFDYDCILLDISLPDGNGLQLLKQLNANNRTEGVIIISAKNSIDDRITGLRLGADDYLSKPFHLSELSARVASLIRRRRFGGSKILNVDELSLDTDAKTVVVNNSFVDVTRKEYDLLLYLMINKNRSFQKMRLPNI